MSEPLSRRDRAARLLTAPGVRSLAGALPMPGLVVVNYHRIAELSDPPLDRGLWSATPDSLSDQLGLLQREFDVIAADEIERALREPRGRRVLITFDDGYRDNYELALPALRRAGLPATFFLSTGFLDRPRLPWWDEIAWMARRGGLGADAAGALNAEYKQLPGDRCEPFLDGLGERLGCGRAPASEGADLWMTWDMAREMRDAGMSFGGHTVDHPILARLDRDGQRHEIAESVSRLRQELGRDIDLFSYPVGLPDCFEATTRELAREAGIRFSFSNYGGYERPGAADPLDLRRTNIGHDMRLTLFESVVRWPRAFASW